MVTPETSEHYSITRFNHYILTHTTFIIVNNKLIYRR
jgi:hypothetical protein